MRAVAFALLIAVGAPALAQEVLADDAAAHAADAARVEALNGAVLQQNQRYKDSLAQYQRDRAAYEAALVEQARRTREIEAAAEATAREHQASQARYEADMARWREEVARSRQPGGWVGSPPKPRPGPALTASAPAPSGEGNERIVCRRFPVVGSLVSTYRTCKPQRDWTREHDNIMAPPAVKGVCPSAGC